MNDRGLFTLLNVHPNVIFISGRKSRAANINVQFCHIGPNGQLAIAPVFGAAKLVLVCSRWLIFHSETPVNFGQMLSEAAFGSDIQEDEFWR